MAIIVDLLAWLFGAFIVFITSEKKAPQVNANAFFDSLNPKTKDDLEKIDNMNGHDFEYFVARILGKNGYSKVKVTSGSNDFGVDILANKDSDFYAIQVKRQEARVSRRAVSDAVAGVLHYNCNKSMVITNSYMSKSGLTFAESTGCLIIDRDELITLIDNANSRIGRTSLKKKDIPKPYKGACEKCGTVDYEYDSYWEEFICKRCGWKVTKPSKPKPIYEKEDNSPAKTQCPKCFQEIKIDQTECFNCGIIFKKYEAYLQKKVSKNNCK